MKRLSPLRSANGRPTGLTLPAGACRAGHTIVELVIVLIVLGIVAAVAVPTHLDSLSRFRAQAAARRVAADLEFARRQAMDEGASRQVVFDPSAESYSLPGVTDLDRSGQTYAVSLPDSEYPAEIVSADFGGASTVTFDMYGRPSCGGTVILQTAGHQATVTLDPDTGRAE